MVPEAGREQRLLQQARELEEKYPAPASRPPLFGVLVGIKDLFNVDGLPTRAGSQLPAGAFTGPEAEVVSYLKTAGALILGKTVSTEFAYFKPGPTRNPVNPLHTPGGSSSGSAAAVAAGFCPLALGTQTIASVIRPAAYCGICGFKPSYGRIPLSGVFPFSQSADHVGYFCNTLAEIRFAAPFLIRDWKSRETSSPPRLGIPTGPFMEQAEPEAQDHFYAKVAELKARGLQVTELELFPAIAEINAQHRKLIAAEFALNHHDLYARYGELYAPESLELYAAGLQVKPSDLPALRAHQLKLRLDITRQMTEHNIDLIVSPATTSSAPCGLQSTGSPLMSLPFNHAGLPMLTLPSGFTSRQLPLGIQIVSKYFEDEYLLAAAASLLLPN